MSDFFVVELMNSEVRDGGNVKNFAWKVSNQLFNMPSNSQVYIKPCVLLGHEEVCLLTVGQSSFHVSPGFSVKERGSG